MRAFRKDLQIIFQDPYASMNPRMLVGDVIGKGSRRSAWSAAARGACDGSPSCWSWWA